MHSFRDRDNITVKIPQIINIRENRLARVDILENFTGGDIVL